MRLSVSIVAATVVALITGIGAAVAVAPALAVSYAGCIAHSTGSFYSVTFTPSSSHKCRTGDSKVRWQQRGPIGPRGPMGLTGLRGAAGTNGTNGTNGAQGPTGPSVTSSRSLGLGAAFVLPANSTTPTSLTCPSGKVAMSGGFNIAGSSVVKASYPDGTTPGKWNFSFVSVAADTVDLSVVCIS